MKPDSGAQASSSTLQMVTMWRCGVRPARPCASPPHALGPRRSFADPKPYTAQLPQHGHALTSGRNQSILPFLTERSHRGAEKHPPNSTGEADSGNHEG